MYPSLQSPLWQHGKRIGNCLGIPRPVSIAQAIVDSEQARGAKGGGAPSCSMVVRLKNQRVPAGWTPNPGSLYRNLISGHTVWVPCTEEPKVRLALECHVPQQFIEVQGQNFIIRTPDLERLDECDPACTICGDAPFPGQQLLDRDVPADLAVTCQRCYPSYLCNLCLCKPMICLACLEPGEESTLDHKSGRRLAALKVFWERDWQKPT